MLSFEIKQKYLTEVNLIRGSDEKGTIDLSKKDFMSLKTLFYKNVSRIINQKYFKNILHILIRVHQNSSNYPVL